jgi:hypothetical protein
MKGLLIKHKRFFYVFLTLILSMTAEANSLDDSASQCQNQTSPCTVDKTGLETTDATEATANKEPTSTVISKVNINIHPIFDESKPKENKVLFRLANRLHIETKPNVVKRDLLFTEGDFIDHQVLEESERILRSRRYLNKAKISKKELEDGTTEVDVDVNEVWTLFPTLSYSRSGGNTEYSFGAQDSNFFGYGKSFNISREKNADRTGTTFEYQDVNTGWHQTNATLAFTDNDDGEKQKISLVRPFFSLNTPSAGGFSYEKFDREESVYNKGDKVDRYVKLSEYYDVFYGDKFDNSDTINIFRWSIGYSKQKDDFSLLPAAENIIQLPQDRDIDIAWLEYQYIKNGFEKSFNLQQINRVEDINFGLQASARIGHVNSIVKDYDNSIQFKLDISDGFHINNNHFVFTKLSIDGFNKDSDIFNGLASGQLRYHWQNFSRGQFFIGLEAARGENLFTDQFLFLGGNNGLRGYPDFYQEGDKRYLFSAEQRLFGQKEWFSLFYLGYALFYDEGRAWGNSLVDQSETEKLRDVGFGLRFSGTRVGGQEEGSSNILHVDVAKPLDGDADISSLQWIIKVKSSF